MKQKLIYVQENIDLTVPCVRWVSSLNNKVRNNSKELSFVIISRKCNLNIWMQPQNAMVTIPHPSKQSCMKFLQALGHSLDHSSISISPTVVSRQTLPSQGGSWTYMSLMLETLFYFCKFVYNLLGCQVVYNLA